MRRFDPRPREEGDSARRTCGGPRPRFDPRPREEGDRRHVQPVLTAGVSIHALVKRATAMREAIDHDHGVSIHALVKRATKLAA